MSGEPSKLTCLRQPIPVVTPVICFLGNLLLSGHPVGTYLAEGESVKSRDRLTSFLSLVGRVVRMMLAAGFIGKCSES